MARGVTRLGVDAARPTARRPAATPRPARRRPTRALPLASRTRATSPSAARSVAASRPRRAPRRRSTAPATARTALEHSEPDPRASRSTRGTTPRAADHRGADPATPPRHPETSCANSWSASALVGNVPRGSKRAVGPVYRACHFPDGSRRTAPEARRWCRAVVAVVMVGSHFAMARADQQKGHREVRRSVRDALTCGNDGAGDGNRTRAVSLGNRWLRVLEPPECSVIAGHGGSM